MCFFNNKCVRLAMHDEKRSVLFMHVIGHNGFLPSAISSVTDFAPDFSVTKLLKTFFVNETLVICFCKEGRGLFLCFLHVGMISK